MCVVCSISSSHSRRRSSLISTDFTSSRISRWNVIRRRRRQRRRRRSSSSSSNLVALSLVVSGVVLVALVELVLVLVHFYWQ